MDWIRKAQRTYQLQGLAGVAGAVLRRMSAKNDTRITAGPVTPLSSEYINWLTFANPGMLDRGNIDCMDYAIRHLPGGAPIVEIGSFCGLSTNVLAYLKEKHNVRNALITCDRWIFEGAENGGPLGDSSTVTHDDYRSFVRESFLRNVRMFSRADLPFTIELFSDEFFDAWAGNSRRRDVFGREVTLGGPMGFCYIDGNHTYDFARRDFENCDRYLEPGGFLLFDDSADDSEWGVRRVVREVAGSGRYRLVAKKPNYFFQKLK